MFNNFIKLRQANFILLTLLYIFPIVLLIWFVAHYSFITPYWDQWRIVPMFAKMGEGNIDFADLFSVHGHHRILFPKILMSILAFATGWNTKYEMLCSILLTILSFWGLYQIANNQRQPGDKYYFHTANILAGLLLFSLVQQQNWLWGFTLFWFGTNLSLIIGLYLLHGNPKIQPNQRLILAAISCFVGSFTLAQGLFSWLVLIPSIFVLNNTPKIRLKNLLIWLSLFILCSWLYSIDYNPIRKPQPLFILQQPLQVLQYFFGVLGLPFVRLPIPAVIIGLILFTIFLGLAFYFLRKINWQITKLNLITPAIPWLALGLFSLIACLSITAGRAQYGLENVISSTRYTTASILLMIAIVYLGKLFFNRHEQAINSKFSQLIYQGLAIILTIVILINSYYVIQATERNLPYMKSRQTCLELINYLDESAFFNKSPDSCLVLMNGKTWLVREGANSLEKLGWRTSKKNVEFMKNPSEVYGYLDQLSTNSPFTVNTSENITLTGWATLPDFAEKPATVFLSRDDQTKFFANGYITLDSPDLAKHFQSPLYRQARWRVTFSADSLPIGNHTIFAWVYHPGKNQFMRLRDQVSLIVTGN